MAARPLAVAALPRALPTNPYCDLLYEHVARLGVEVLEGSSRLAWLLRHRRRCRVLHFHWPERHFRSGSLLSAIDFALRLLAARLLGYRIVWTVHNAAPHEGATVGDRLVRATLRRLATLVVHCEAGRAALGRAGHRALAIPHGSYVGRYPNEIGAAAARARLGIAPEARVLLAFGQVRPYKGIGPLLRAFAALAAPEARLVVAGAPVAGARQTLAGISDPRVRLALGHVPDAEVQVYMNAADLVVLPYRAVLTSGAAMLALSFGRGVVAPRLGCLADLERAGTAILYDPRAPDGLERALARALEVDPARLGQAARRLVAGLSWDAIARRHLAAYGFAPSLTVLRGGDPEAGHRAAPARARVWG